ncbi:MAG: EAL domain-containing protein [Actinobacteria bacterium]|nr:EAL domain-containing protein [Actinomycetota bacterium]
MGQDKLGRTSINRFPRGPEPEGGTPRSDPGGERTTDVWRSAPVGITTIGHDGVLLDVNEAFCELTGYSEDRLIATRLGDICHTEDAEAERGIERLLSGELHSHQAERRLLHQDGHWVWVLTSVAVATAPPADPPHLVAFFQDITELKKIQAELSRQSLHDSLTGLPNRILFLDRLDIALSRLGRRSGLVAILFIDLDRFKGVNDSLGHQAGDELLKGVAGRLQAHLRPGDTAARFGGDEFIVLCDDIDDRGTIREIAERISATIITPFALVQGDVRVTASIGVAISGAQEKAVDLIQRADGAMYLAKQRASRYEFSDGPDPLPSPRLVTTEHALDKSLERGELRVFYQPEVCLKTGRIGGFEALLRWEHPELGLLAPDKFIARAEPTPLIGSIGAWVLEKACRQLRVWQAGPGGQHLTVAVNVSAWQLAQPDLSQIVFRVLSDAEIDGSCLSLEIMESAALEDTGSASAALHALKSLGVGVIIDDFGKGYSSLSYLKALPIDALKMDRSYVSGIGQNPADNAIARAIVHLARALGLEVVAEGVESSAQLAECRLLGCDLAQGFYFAPPQTAGASSEMLRRDPRW